MTWFLLALIGHLANGVAFIIDKVLLGSAFRRSATYAGLVGALSVLVVFAIPWMGRWPVGGEWIGPLLSGATFVLALWAFFAALSRAEASRVVPIVGSLIPILTLVGSYLFLNERLADQTILGFVILIIATIILSGGGKGRLNQQTVWIAVLSAMLFAFSTITGKAAYDSLGFLEGFIITRLGAVAISIFILCVLDREAGREFLSILRSTNKKTSKKNKQPGKGSAILALVGQSLGAVGFLFVQWAISKGSPTIVNSMQAVQYAILLIVGLALRKRAPKLLGEDVSSNILMVKVGALILTAIGMALII